MRERDQGGGLHGLPVENHEVNVTSPSSPASLQPPAAPQIKLNGDMSWCHTANQVETNFFTLNNFLKHFEKRFYFPRSSTVDLSIQHLKMAKSVRSNGFSFEAVQGVSSVKQTVS